MSELPVTVDELPQVPRSRRFELTLAVLLGLAAIAMAFTSYQADLKRGESLREFQNANRLNSNSVDAYGQADAQRALDQQLFVNYSKAALEGNTEAVRYLRNELSPDLRQAIVRWENSAGNANSPFDGESPAYEQPLYTEGDDYAEQSKAAFAVADDLRRDADAFTLIGVFLASALFLYGIAAVSRIPRIRRGLTAVGFVIYVGAVLALVGFSI
jgi:hypothetical protein